MFDLDRHDFFATEAELVLVEIYPYGKEFWSAVENRESPRNFLLCVGSFSKVFCNER